MSLVTAPGPAASRLRDAAGRRGRQAARRAAVQWRRSRVRARVLARRDAPRIPEVELPEQRPARDVHAAVVLDEFSTLALGYEWRQTPVTPTDWRERLAADRPDLLFVESAWHGNDDAWRLHLTHRPSDDLRALVDWCRQAGIPTVFWNKEDPPGYDVFLETARLFDQVFTVDADRVPAYREALGHDRVDLLPFAAQPRIHTPVRRGAGRAHPVAFAGTWFADKHPQRRVELAWLLGAAREHGLHIYSRMLAEDSRYQFPRDLAPHVVGSLPYRRMLAGYTSYRVFLNVNTVTESKTMCSRRIFELSAAQTAVVSTPSAAIAPVFGDDVTVVHDAEEARAALEVLLRHDDLRERQALRAHRTVHDDHLYEHRVATVLRSVGHEPADLRPSVSLLVATRRPEQLDHVLRTVAAQHWPHVQLVLVPHAYDVPRDLHARAARLGLRDVVVRPAGADLTLGQCLGLAQEAADGDLVAKLDDDNLYLPHYLTDLVRAHGYSEADVVGKWAHLVHLEASGATLLRFEDHEHRHTDLVQGGTILASRERARDVGWGYLPRGVDTDFLRRLRADGGRVYSADRFSFVSVRRAAGDHTWTVSDAEILRRSSRLLFHGDPTRHAEV
jgi:nicotinamidase-related amidase